jgi:hypothetical protein
LVNGGFRNVSNTKGSFLENIHECGYAIGCHNISHGNNVAYSGTTDPSEYFFDVFSCGRSTHFYGVLNSG